MASPSKKFFVIIVTDPCSEAVIGTFGPVEGDDALRVYDALENMELDLDPTLDEGDLDFNVYELQPVKVRTVLG